MQAEDVKGGLFSFHTCTENEKMNFAQCGSFKRFLSYQKKEAMRYSTSLLLLEPFHLNGFRSLRICCISSGRLLLQIELFSFFTSSFYLWREGTRADSVAAITASGRDNRRSPGGLCEEPAGGGRAGGGGALSNSISASLSEALAARASPLGSFSHCQQFR